MKNYECKEENGNIKITEYVGKGGEVVIPKKINDVPVIHIDSWAFNYCSSITSVVIPNSVESIGFGAFNWCSSLINVYMPDSVTSIGGWAFYSCSSLMSVTLKAKTPPKLGDYAFKYYDSDTEGYHTLKKLEKIVVPAGSLDAYKNADGWSEYEELIVGY